MARNDNGKMSRDWSLPRFVSSIRASLRCLGWMHLAGAGLILFIVMNWLVFCGLDRLAPNDFYTFHYASEELFSGNIHLYFVPPLFPLLLGSIGRLFQLLGLGHDPFILAGRFIALVSALGTACVSYLFLKKIIAGRAALAGVLTLIVTAPFLKQMSLPITDMPFLFLFCLSLYFLYSGRFGASLICSGIAFLFRFEGMLLLALCLFNWVSSVRKKLLTIWLGAGAAIGGLVLFAGLVFPRVAEKLQLLFLKKGILFFVKYPLELAHLIYGNTLFFLPATFPVVLKWTMFVLLTALFTAGIVYISRSNRTFAVTLLVYEALFFLVKGYMIQAGSGAVLDPEVETRRLLSGIYIIYLVSFIGAVYLYRVCRIKLKKHRSWLQVIVIMGIALICLRMPLIKGKFLLNALLLLPLLIYLVLRYRGGRLLGVLTAIVLTLFVSQLYYESGKRSISYIDGATNKAGYAIARWINFRLPEEGAKMVILSHRFMVSYYRNQNVDLLDIRLENRPPLTDEQLLDSFLELLIQQRIKYVAFDLYYNPFDFPLETRVKKILFQERDRGRYFRVKRNLTYRGKYVGTVLMPRYEDFPGNW